MKYIQRYIKTLSDKFVENKSDISNSVYYKITDKDNKFIIRCSDHCSVMKTFVNDDIDIIQAFGEPDKFIVMYKDYNVPMIKGRKETKQFIKFAYDLYKMKSSQRESEKLKTVKKSIEGVSDSELFKFKELPKGIANKWNSHSIEINKLKSKHTNMFNGGWDTFYSLLVKVFRNDFTFDKKYRNILIKYFEEGYLSKEEICEVLYNLKYLEPKRAFDGSKFKQYLYYKYCSKKKEETAVTTHLSDKDVDER